VDGGFGIKIMDCDEVGGVNKYAGGRERGG